MGNLKAALTAIFNTNTYTSSTSGIASKKIPVTESNGLPSGQIGMSDLASVLGVSIGILPMGEVVGENETDAVTVVQTIVSQTPTLSNSTCFVGIYRYQSRSMFWGYLYANKATGAFQIMKYDGSVKLVKIQSGVYTEVS